ncbi:thioredoxin-like protein [Rhizodiscina lignyota]|uniref:Thioredoxin-like protein n=1 Tax=Rhizodiscina lignyota TaxID=1504668 RepID=A0A9P4IQJ6_9PEZI|nr:thioredoxin-like protein [Rhizodiscina lignyota]
MAPPKLYTRKDSGNCYKVRLLAALLGIELEFIELDRLLNDQQHSPDFLAINPRGQIPVLVHGEKTFTDSAAILVYLAGSRSDPGTTETPSSFWSNDVAEQAAIVDWLAFASSWIQTGVALARFIVIFKGVSTLSEPALAKATTKGIKSLEILQTKLRANEWLALGRPTIADVAVFAYVALAPMGNISLDPYPAVKSWISRVRSLPGFIPID